MTSELFDQTRTISVELYKSLRTEEALYLEKVPALWLQKFTLLGAMIAFIVVRHKELMAEEATGSALLIAAVLAIPVLAMLIDAKILEYGLHARAISRFVRRHATPDSVEARWEGFLWGDEGDPSDVGLVRLRSATTVIVTAVPTALLIALAGLVVGIVAGHGSLGPLVGGLAATVYVMATVWFARKVWPSA
jgi:hypothetical protein